MPPVDESVKGKPPSAVATARAASDEQEGWWSVSPVALVSWDATRRVLRANDAFVALVGSRPATLDSLPGDLLALLLPSAEAAQAGPQRGLLAGRPAPMHERTGWVALPGGRRLRLRAGARWQAGGPGVAGGGRWFAAIEDRSLEDERDLARLEMGALMHTASIGVATYDAARGWLPVVNPPAAAVGAAGGARPSRLGMQRISRDLVEAESLPEYDKLQTALKRSQPVEVRYAVRHPDAGLCWLLTRVEPGALSEGRPTMSVVTLDITEQELARQRNERLAHELELMFELSDVGIAYQRDGRLGRANQALCDLTGFSRAELQGMALAHLHADDEASQAIDAHERAALVRSGRSRVERRLLRRDGSLLWVQCSQRLVEDANPGSGTICSYVNVDERRRARESLTLQADRTRAILDSVLVGIVTVADHGIEWMNRSARRMFGGELADFVGEPISTVATADPDHPLRRTHYRQTLEEGQSETFECRLKAHDGREFWVVGNVVVTGNEARGKQLTFALLDIERRRQAETSIAQARSSLQRIIETAPLAIALFDADTQQVRQFNHMMVAFAGASAESMTDRPLLAWLDGPTSVALTQDFHQALRSAEVARREIVRDSPEGPRAWDVRCVSLRNTGGPEQILLVASDVTEQRDAQQARLDAAIAQREMLVREVHHRIKNNLQGVAGLLQHSAQRHPDAAAAIAEAVGHVHAIAQVHGLQVGQGGPMRVRGVIEAIAASVQRMFGRTITVSVQGAAPHRLALSEADSIPVALTVNELLTNAVKHGQGDIDCTLVFDETAVVVRIANEGRLPAGFVLARVPSGLSGLGLVRALLPRKGAAITLAQSGARVVASLSLQPPGVQVLDPL